MGPRYSIEFGLLAPSIKEQYPAIPDETAELFDADSKAIARLRVRGLITPSVRNAAYEKLAKRVETAIRAASDTRPGANGRR